MGIRKYGTSNDDKIYQESMEVKEIVKTIMEHGVSQRQIIYLIHDLSLNLENLEYCRRIKNLLEELSEDDVSNLEI